MEPLRLDIRHTALVLIDLQKGITGRPAAPRPSSEIIANGVRLADRFRASGATVVLVNVTFSTDGLDRLQTPVDSPMPGGPLPPDWAELVPELNVRASDILITKHQWGAFYGTELDLQLRRRAIRTIVIGGISTNFGVESTARDGWERGYELVFVEDAMGSMSAEAHAFAVGTIFARIGRVRSTSDVLGALA